MAEKILTRHPDPAKRGRNVDRRNYEAVRGAVLATLRTRGEMTSEALQDEIGRRLRGRFAGSVSWYYVTVKLDLEARKLIERVPRSRPQRLRLTGSRAPSRAKDGSAAQRRVSSRRR
ncbi:MAG: DUF6958 family protein [Anaerolineales bacterium]